MYDLDSVTLLCSEVEESSECPEMLELRRGREDDRADIIVERRAGLIALWWLIVLWCVVLWWSRCDEVLGCPISVLVFDLVLIVLAVLAVLPEKI